MTRAIALLTDFGLTDHYVGSLKSVIFSMDPQAVVFDLTHDVRPQNIWEGAYLLSSIYNYLPQGSIVVAVIDPGVGSERDAICIKTERCFLMAPDNGLLSIAVKNKKYNARKITNPKYFLNPVSATFHGRDIFAPCAAHLSKRDIFEDLGPRTQSLHELKVPEPVIGTNGIKGELIYLDRFGNAMTNIAFHQSLAKHPVCIRFRKQNIPLKSFFSEGKANELIAVWNSSRALEIAVFKGSAEKLHQLKLGEPIEVCRVDS